MKTAKLLMAMAIVITAFTGCGNNGKKYDFNIPIGRAIAPDARCFPAAPESGIPRAA